MAETPGEHQDSELARLLQNLTSLPADPDDPEDREHAYAAMEPCRSKGIRR
jgi:hypothetical protein